MEEKKEGESRSAILASTVQKTGLAAGTYRLLRGIAFSIVLTILAIFLMYVGIPWYVGAFLVFMAAAILIFEIVSLKKVASVDLQSPNEPVNEKILLEPGEELAAAIPAVMQYGKTRSAVYLGTGKVLTPENALIITNKSIWALTVPLPGVNQVVSGTDIGKWQWMTAYKDIREKLQEMIDTLPLDEVLRRGRGVRLMNLKSLKAVKTIPFTQALSLIRADGQKFGYSIREKEDYLRAKEIFKIS